MRKRWRINEEGWQKKVREGRNEGVRVGRGEGEEVDKEMRE